MHTVNNGNSIFVNADYNVSVIKDFTRQILANNSSLTRNNNSFPLKSIYCRRVYHTHIIQKSQNSNINITSEESMGYYVSAAGAGTL